MNRERNRALVGPRSSGEEDSLGLKERIDIARSIADFHLTRVAARHAIEWRLAFGSWVVLLASVVGIKERPSDVQLYLALGVATPLFLFLLSWLGARNAQDAKRAYYYIDYVSAALRGSEFADTEPVAWRKLGLGERWGHWVRSCLSPAFALQGATTVILATLVYLFAGRVSG